MSNSLAVMRPELVREWSDKNLPLTPDKITYGSNKIVWWKADCGHEWQASVKARSGGENCPICSGARVIEGINDLATLKPELVQEWSEKNKNRLDFEKTILIPTTGDELDDYREEYNKMLLEKATGANAIVQDKYMTISVNKKNVEDARNYFARVGADLIVMLYHKS